MKAILVANPKGGSGKNLAHPLKLARKVLILVQPSVFDMVATSTFLQTLMAAVTGLIGRGLKKPAPRNPVPVFGWLTRISLRCYHSASWNSVFRVSIRSRGGAVWQLVGLITRRS